MPEPVARRSIDLLDASGVDVWVFAKDRWLLRVCDGDYVPRERKTIEADPIRVGDFGPHLAEVGKIVGASSNFGRLAECEKAVRAALGREASVARSRPYYLDITPRGVDKGTFLEVENASAAVQREAHCISASNGNDGFAEAVERYILPPGGPRSPHPRAIPRGGRGS